MGRSIVILRSIASLEHIGWIINAIIVVVFVKNVIPINVFIALMIKIIILP
jgi:hypothetical protein